MLTQALFLPRQWDGDGSAEAFFLSVNIVIFALIFPASAAKDPVLPPAIHQAMVHWKSTKRQHIFGDDPMHMSLFS